MGEWDTGRALVVARDAGHGLRHRLGAGRPWRLRRAAAPTLKRVRLELGGKAPVIVFDDADPVAEAAEGIAGAGYFNAGETWGPHAGPRRAPGARGAGWASLVEQAEGRTVGGHQTTTDADYGPLNNANQLERPRTAASWSTTLPGHT